MTSGRKILGLLSVSALPFLAVVLADLWTKSVATQTLNTDLNSSVVKFTLLQNFGFVGGSMSNAHPIIRIVVPAAIGGFVLYLFALMQYFLPIKSGLMRTGLSFIAAGHISNLLERMQRGYVTDFIVVRLGPVESNVFNLADLLQWIGVGLVAVAAMRWRHVLYPVNERRGRKWIDPAFQTRYCIKFCLIGSAFAGIAGIVSYTFLKLILDMAQSFDERVRDGYMSAFLVTYAAIYGVFMLSLIVVGIIMSHRIIGPVRAFERYLDEILAGQSRAFRLRERDEFKHLEQVADRFQVRMLSDLRVAPRPLIEDDMVPTVNLKTIRAESFDLHDLKGKPVWLMFLRYATCPLCALYLHQQKDLLAKARQAGVEVFAIYESTEEQFRTSLKDTGATLEFLSKQQIHLIADPKRLLYRKFRTGSSVAALFNPRILSGLLRARFLDFRQGSIDGALGQLPAHFLIDQIGRFRQIYYGRHQTDHIAASVVEAFLSEALSPGLDALSD